MALSWFKKKELPPLDVPPPPPKPEEIDTSLFTQDQSIENPEVQEAETWKPEDTKAVFQEPLRPMARKALTPTEPLYIKGEDYREILTGVNRVKNLVGEAEGVLSTLQTLQKTKETDLEKYRQELEDIQRKIVYIDKKIGG